MSYLVGAEAGAGAGEVTAPAPQLAEGDRFIWDIPEASFGPIFMTVKRAMLGGQVPRVVFTCFDPQRDVTYQRTARLPLSAHMIRKDWTMDAALNCRRRV